MTDLLAQRLLNLVPGDAQGAADLARDFARANRWSSEIADSLNRKVILGGEDAKREFDRIMRESIFRPPS